MEPEPIQELTPEQFAESHSILARPTATGAQILVLREGFDDTAALVNSVCAEYGEYRVASVEPGAELPPDIGPVYDELAIAVIDHPQPGVSVTIAATLAALDEVEDHLPEFYAFADQATGYVNGADTWGRKATGASTSTYTGTGIRVAVLDTGIDLKHPEVSSKVVSSASFVPGEAVQDRHGHGTHCAGTIAGEPGITGIPKYGVAPGVDLLVAKVLSNSGSGRQRDIVDGMRWAVSEGANVISMSLGQPVPVGAPHNPLYERMAAYALGKDCLVVAASGNDSARRFGYVAPARAPADSPSAMAVAAVDQTLTVADFSNGGINPGGGELDLAAPGVHVLSSWPLPRRHRSISGTSMACPHVSGIAALWMEATGDSGTTLRGRLNANTRALAAPAIDVGNGLVQAP